MSDWFMKQPCKHCPFRRDVKPFLHPARADEISGAAWNPYNEFHCHKTTEYDEDAYGDGDMVAVETSMICAGFLAMQINEGKECPDGFTPSDNVYSDHWEMTDAYREEWEKRHGTLDDEEAA